MKTTTILLFIAVLAVGALFTTTRLDYMGEIHQLEFLVQQNQNLGRHNVHYARALEEKIVMLTKILEARKDKAVDKNIVEQLDNLKEQNINMSLRIMFLEIQAEMLTDLLMRHLNPPCAPDQNPWRDINGETHQFISDFHHI